MNFMTIFILHRKPSKRSLVNTLNKSRYTLLQLCYQDEPLDLGSRFCINIPVYFFTTGIATTTTVLSRYIIKTSAYRHSIK